MSTPRGRPEGGREKPSRPSRPGIPVTSPQEAALYDAVVVPRYSALFGRMMLAEIAEGTRAQVLDVGCGTGHPSFDVLRKLGETGRVVAIDRDPALVDIARRRALADAGRRIFFKVEPLEQLSFGDEVFDLVVGNLVLGSFGASDEGAALSEIRRVLVPGGRVLLTRAMSGSFEEILDMFREVALRRELGTLTRRVEQLAAHYPSKEGLASQLRAAGFESISVREEELRLPFRNAHEIFADPMVRLVAMPEWRWLCGMEPGNEAVLEDVERALETYFANGPISLTVRAGLVTARTAS